MSLILQLLFIAGGVVCYGILLIVYRLWFHPLANFPGPKLAAATKWYEAYFDLFVPPGGQFFYKIKRMHEIYGPVVRINPNEIHIHDPAWVDTLYTNPGQGVRDRYPPAAHMAGMRDSVFGSISSHAHRVRRSSMSSLFSKNAASTSVDMVYVHAEALLRAVNSQITRHGSAEMRMNFLALATDTVTDYCFGDSTNFLDDEQVSTDWKRTIQAVLSSTPLAKQFPWFMPFAVALPHSILEVLNPELARIAKLHADMGARAQAAARSYTAQVQEKHNFSTNDDKRHDLFGTILASNVLDPSDKKASRIAQEGFTTIVAGSETTGRILTTATYYILACRDKVLPRLRQELRIVMPKLDSKPSLKALEDSPWLTAIIKESLRITALFTSRSPLVCPNETLVYENWVIPPGTPVGMTLREIQLNADTYENPMEFKPERWLWPNVEKMQRNFMPFGRGSYMCIGMNIAWVELYVVLAVIFRRHRFELHDTRFDRDIDIVRDCFVGEVSLETQGVRIKYAEDN